ncbi:NAD-dependent epimerase/dehydratase family protein [Lachnoclostridium phytofermentans]|uniref:NAD-dependent epimerase/dehydratase n=1 Tax=Lachnoclostridium phytofermentans (strain ATCC 700394 / DSM 18823 / ISDg) TaxID=357809 RepID=A9KHB2_LACP7|nr:NAD(P)-dependent oxidoreductase [Lachnoclostridium phytofermentans]ABX40779.1 NAD-dependent epimerase/dehydratase [Lachnoclostridium phytofermentans ISDg]
MWTEERLDTLLTNPSSALIEDMKKITGDIMILGAGGKMGPTLSLLAKRACESAGITKRIIAVSRFSDPIVKKLLSDHQIEMISADLLEPGAIASLPKVENIIYMAGKKFGTNGNEYQTWAMNATVPSHVMEHFKDSRIVVFSTGNIYPKVAIYSGGATEETHPEPVGEYAMSSLSRERIFEYGANTYGTKLAIYRLNYAVDLRYGVLYDIAENIMNDRPISLESPCFNCIWQGDANEVAIRLLLHADSSVFRLNVTGPETIGVKETALKLAKKLGKEVSFVGEESSTAYLNNASKMTELFGYPTVSINTLIDWQAEWILSGGRSLGKPTHFEERKGNF